MNPGPLEEFIFFDHPSGRNRIYAAMRWKAENLPLMRWRSNPHAETALPVAEKK
jgi:hypothetical protein